ncbi:hypothetical protein [Streptomyces xiaopingdaonensis]|uniref:hypothetical protein n=1 Tax=Streptomyces xiaopingdaonensis TaxID=1565415 RepID=UPI001ED90997|nr:hypothetical protein [Streptomyces xiaopingdaonensis]
MPGVGPSTLQTHRRPLLTAAVSGGLLLALWFVPSADATPDGARAPGSDHGVNQTVDRGGAGGTTADYRG